MEEVAMDEQRHRVDERLVEAAVAQMNERRQPGENAAAAIYLDTFEIVTSIAFDPPNVYAGCCHETGAILEAYRRDRSVLASVCVCQPPGSPTVLVLPPCGICQERLFWWGADVEVGVPDPDDQARWLSKPLREIAPYYWATPFL
jgi:cytidine deaminase